ncbi:uroporphyrinogen-III synthase [Pelagibacterales bacterium SAG-MED25]|uniref:uroporphyrinogen-III synthase n=1 Tax=Pelagibacter sp. (strain HTCC7211) TaxID=439493 RepID=UPI0002F58E80|nr:uroporphyrinogen-III synthase [Candidatus Pelagibacter sp. HTCC7211]MBD1151626.1 uroporphyrinogen-III synthase [Pelagibacterales bacterium SAG-MED25]
MHILLTRPLEDCSEMILKFKSLGHQVSHLPLLVVEKVNYDSVNFPSFGGIIFTSANAIKFLDLKGIDKKILCFCVGEATEKTARNNGFQNVIAAEGNVENLKELILQNFDKKDGSLIYISGETVSTDLDQQLLKVGYNVKRIVNYRTSHNKNFNEEFVKELKLKMPDIVYVYSQNSAASFLNYIKLQQLESLWMNTNLMCIGEKTSSILNEIKWKKIFLFNPGEEEFLLYKI